MSYEVKKSIIDHDDRKWIYNDSEGCWSYGSHTIGCAARNGRKWSIWSGPQTSFYEYKSLKEAMLACY